MDKSRAWSAIGVKRVAAVALAVTFGWLGAAGCSQKNSCSTDSDCFEGEVCAESAGKCVPSETVESDAGSDTEQEPVDAEPDDADESDPDDTSGCQDPVDGGCRCEYENDPHGVCAKALIDPQSGECSEPATHQSPEESCFDGLDNDCDEKTDCDDPDCSGRVCGEFGDGSGATCAPGTNNACQEVKCYDGKDNDGDGLIDCRDDNCDPSRPCEKSGGVAKCPGPASILGGGADCGGSDCNCHSNTCGSADTCHHLLFVTRKAYTGDLGGIRGANKKCNDQAEKFGIQGRWQALLSVDGDAAESRIAVHNPIHNGAGFTVVSDANSLWKSASGIGRPVLYGPNGEEATGKVWTATTAGGEHTGPDCSDWTSTSRTGVVGAPSQTGEAWMDSGTGECSEPHHLYCIDGQAN